MRRIRVMKKAIAMVVSLAIFISLFAVVNRAERVEPQYIGGEYTNVIAFDEDGKGFAYIEEDTGKKKVSILSLDGTNSELGEYQFDNWNISTRTKEFVGIYDFSGGDYNESVLFKSGKVYDNAFAINENTFYVEKDGEKKVIDKEGNTLFTTTFTYWYHLFDNYYIVYNQDYEEGVANDKGEIVLPFEDVSMGAFQENKVFCRNNFKSNITEVFDSNLNKVFTSEEDAYIWELGENLFAADTSEQVTIFDNMGVIKNTVDLSSYENYYFWKEKKLFIVRKGSQYDFIDLDGVKKAEDLELEYIYPHDAEEYILAEKDGKFGFLDEKGDIQIPFIYEDAYNFISGRAEVVEDGKHGIIDINGNILIETENDQIYFFDEGNGLVVEKNGKQGVYNEDKKVVDVDTSLYRYVFHEKYEDRYLIVATEDGRGIIDYFTGEEILTPSSDYRAVSLTFASEGVAIVRKENDKCSILKIENVFKPIVTPTPTVTGVPTPVPTILPTVPPKPTVTSVPMTTPTPTPTPTLTEKPAVVPPSKVSGVKAISKKKKVVVVTWNKNKKDAKGYEVFRSLKKNKGFKKVKTLKGVNFKNKKLKSKKTYYYKVRAYNLDGNKKIYGKYSAVKKVKVK